METLMNLLAAIYLVVVVGRICWLILRGISRALFHHRITFIRRMKTLKKLYHVHHK